MQRRGAFRAQSRDQARFDPPGFGKASEQNESAPPDGHSLSVKEAGESDNVAGLMQLVESAGSAYLPSPAGTSTSL